MWLGHPEAHPEYMTQGETLDELKENLRDIIKDVDDQLIPMVRTHEDMVLP
jgi:predicted RNase H-like HicB family nuclease